MKVKEESEKVGLKLNIQKTNIMASGPITSWQIDGETMETVTNFIFGAPKITADDDSSHEIKRRLLLGRKVMTNLDSILKNRDITLPTKVRLVKAMVFPVVVYACESWTIKRAGHWRTDAFELWCWRRRLLPWCWCWWRKTVQSTLDWKEIQPVHPKGNQSLIFIGRTDAEAETPNTLVTWCKELIHLKKDWCWERLKAGEEGDDRGWDGWMASPSQSTWIGVNSRSWVMDREAWHAAVHRVTRVERNWTKLCMHIQNFSISAPQMLVPELGPLSLWVIVGLYLIILKNQTANKLQLTLE